jgi:hypothetical protein
VLTVGMTFFFFWLVCCFCVCDVGRTEGMGRRGSEEGQRNI